MAEIENEQVKKNLGTLTLLDTLEGHEDRVWCVCWSPSRQILLSCSGDKSIRVWIKQYKEVIDSKVDKEKKVAQEADVHFPYTYRCTQVLDAHTRTVRCVAWNPNDRMFASACFDGSIGIWKVMADSSPNNEEREEEAEEQEEEEEEEGGDKKK
ncbi:hypothetical protein RFI_18534 [Reticulomyxa filosa]|uniref:Uncharacterized protein n=1 Tax=Reticulomyxa filosa TaxID=46433 RepID=X6MXG7_RETFI|nr:hypothetical protein RFI_18534 [Reticulomyxa filosa]|eukprot:ETO18720.1 hypothetical protein RFI_18534 [Reticulomyxa filosa]